VNFSALLLFSKIIKSTKNNIIAKYIEICNAAKVYHDKSIIMIDTDLIFYHWLSGGLILS